MATPATTSESARPCQANILRSLIAHGKLFEDIDNNHPEGDVRLRFLKLRTIRAQYVEGRVWQQWRRYDDFMSEVKAGKKDPNHAEVLDEFEDIMTSLIDYLDLNSRALAQDSKAAQAPVVDQYMMDNVWRYWIQPPENGIRAPNGELKSLYGSQGEPVSPYFTAPRGCEDNFFRSVILHRVMIPLDHRVLMPCRRLYNRMLCRHMPSTDHGLGGRALRIIVSALESTLAVTCMAGSVVLLYNLKSTKDRFIVASLFSLVFPYSMVFLSKEATRLFTLTAGYWAVMVVFIAASSYGSNN
ncbi:hypothetical protein K491DRAFT_722300 [Lophiostoma macrostomum CBS 122681]|uniref:DUF6594 domain-containing protein n=1 Tax=Lophiostoma macrostomum CBS 122681 TaxID=1314788 RepID=A0A6A6SMP3_9PLEO|nr:hypothetical protein K491DRAFT_722300 [Lophiostoma macrostomum CBS 122681]